MESAPAPVEEVHTLAPENLPPEMAPRPAFNPKIFDRARKVEIVAELMQSGLPTSKMAAKVSEDSGCLVTAPQLRGWSNAYAGEATKLLKARNAERLLGPPIPDDTPETRDAYTPGERRKILAQYHASGLGLEAGAQAVGVKHDTLRKWLAAEAAAKKPYPARKAIAGPGANISDKTREAALEKVVRGIGLQDVARELLVSPKSIRVWYFKKFGKKLEAREIKRAAQMEGKQTMERAKAKNPFAPVSEEAKAKAVKMIKSGVVLHDVAKQLGISTYTIRMAFQKETGEPLKVWKLQAEVMKQRAQKAGVAPSFTAKEIMTKTGPRKLYTEKEKILYAVRYKKLRIDNVTEGARILGVGNAALRDWVIKFDAMKPQARGAAARHAEPAAEPAEGKDPIPRKEKLKALERVAAGERATDVAQEFGVHPTSVRNWWQKLRTAEPWPAQIAFMGKKVGPVTVKRGPQKKTIDRISVREAVLSNSQVITAEMAEAAQATQHLNGHAQPISTGKATHDALIFLQLARDEYQKAVKAGKMRVDDPTMLFPMLALHTLSK